MRQLFIATLFLAIGCAAQGLPLESGGTSGGGGGGGASGGAGGGGTQGGGGVVDMARPPDLGGPGAKCTTACDCKPGLGCLQGSCTSGFEPIFCCESPECPTSGFCQSKSGNFSKCGSSSGGPRDLSVPIDGGGGSFCHLVPCTSDQTCALFGWGNCATGANGSKTCGAK